MAKNPKSGTAEIESMGAKVVRTIRARTLSLLANIERQTKRPFPTEHAEAVYGLIHQALLDQWTDGHDDASTAAIRMVDEARQ